MNISNIISKPVLNLFSGKLEGTVKNTSFDPSLKKVRYLKIFDNEEEEYILPTDKIISCENDVVVIKNSEALIPCISAINSQENNPINLNVYSTEGENFGRLTDITLNNNFETELFITQTKTFERKNILNITTNIIINCTNKTIRLCDLKPKLCKFEKATIQNPVIIMPTQQEISATKSSYQISSNPTPQKLVANSNFLIGRKVLKTIYGINNEIIIKKDSIIGTKNLESAKKHNKLNELAVFSK